MMRNFGIFHTVICKDCEPSPFGFNYINVVTFIGTFLPFNISEYKLVICFLNDDNSDHFFEVLTFQDATHICTSSKFVIPNTAKPTWTWISNLPHYNVIHYGNLNFVIRIDGVDTPDIAYCAFVQIRPPSANGDVHHLRI